MHKWTFFGIVYNTDTAQISFLCLSSIKKK